MRYNSTSELRDAVIEKEKAYLQQQMSPNNYQAQSGISAGLGNPLGQIADPSQKRPPELHVATATLNDRVVALMNELSKLEQRLETVLRPQAPSSQTAAGAVGYGANTQLGQAIAQATSIVDNGVQRIRDLLDRLEI